jgi:hydroxymethylbilane synthase
MMMRIGARSSPLSRVQVYEACRNLTLDWEPVWVETRGDLDKTTSLRTLEKTDFFTHEIDELLLRGEIRIGIHSAKDLPSPMPDGLCVAARTPSIDPRDAMVLRQGASLASLPPTPLIATSSERREKAARLLRADFRFQDLRGTIAERLQVLEASAVDGVIIAESAILRLGLTHLNRVYLPGETAEGQGQIAVVCRSSDLEMISLWKQICASYI